MYPVPEPAPEGPQIESRLPGPDTRRNLLGLVIRYSRYADSADALLTYTASPRP